MQKKAVQYLISLCIITIVSGCAVNGRFYPVTKYDPETPDYEEDSLAMAYTKAAGIEGEFEDVEIDPEKAAKARTGLPAANRSDYAAGLVLNNASMFGGLSSPGLSEGSFNSLMLLGLMIDQDGIEKRKQRDDMWSQNRVIERFGFWLPVNEHETAKQAESWVHQKILKLFVDVPLNGNILHPKTFGECTVPHCMHDIGYSLWSKQEHSRFHKNGVGLDVVHPLHEIRRGQLFLGEARKTKSTPFENKKGDEFFFVPGSIGLVVINYGKEEERESMFDIENWNVSMSNYFKGDNFYKGAYLESRRSDSSKAIPVVLHEGKAYFFIKPKTSFF